MRLQLFLLLLSIAYSLNYTEYLSIPNPGNNYTKTVFSPDFTLVVFYGPYSSTVGAYSPSNWTQYISPTLTSFYYPCTDIELFIDPSNYLNYLYSSNQGEIRKRTVQPNGGYIDGYMWTLNDTHIDIVRAVPSITNDLYAAFCRDSPLVYTASLSIYSSSPTIIDFSAEGNIVSIRWREQTSQLIISGGNSTSQRFLKTYDVNSKEFGDLTSITSGLVFEAVSSKDGSVMYFIEEAAGQQNVQIYEFATQNQRSLVVAGAGQLLGLGLQGNFLTVFDSNSIYVWDLVGQTLIGTYASTLSTMALAPDGSQIITLASASTNKDSDSTTSLTVYKLCSGGQFYNPTSNTCSSCLSPCIECFYAANHCGSCPNQTYLSRTFTCDPCIANCLICQDGFSCSTCLNSNYFYDYDSSQCLLCSGSILACVECYNKNQCKTCNASGHWQQTPNLQCTCMQSYVQVGNLCESCPNHCFNCSSTSFCTICDPYGYWTNTTSGDCACRRGYYQNGETCLYCWDAMEGCLECQISTVCSSCQYGYTLNELTRKCDIITTSHTVVIVVATVGGVLVLGVGAFFLWRFLKKKNSKIGQETMLAVEPLSF